MNPAREGEQGLNIMSELPACTATPPMGVHYLEAPRHPGAAALATYWESKRAGRAMPDRADILPSEIARLLPHIFISEALESGEYRFRIFGTALVDLFGCEMTGKRLMDMGTESLVITNAAAASRRWRVIMDRTRDNAGPMFAAGQLVNTIHRTLEWHSFSAPLTAGGSGIAQFIGGLFTEEAP